jgi:broad specificity phosphatase PhoE
MNTDILHILPGIQEQQAFGKFDNENKDSRPFRCKNGTINFNRPMNSKRERLCEPGKPVPDKDIELCTYGGKLNFFGKNTSTCSSEVIWDKLIDFINVTNMNIDSFAKNPGIVRRNFFIVSHHNTLKKCILSALLKTDKKLDKKLRRNIANCSCFLLEKIDNEWTFKIIFDGFPDKTEYKYFQGIGKLLFQNASNEWSIFQSFLANLQHPENTRIFLIRHGNAFHNKPLQLTGSMFNRTVDTNLTPLGIYQARILGEELIKSGYLKEENITVKDTAEIVNPLEIIAKEKVGGESTTENINIFCASTMNRAQHTVLELIYAMNVTNNLENPQEPEEEVKKRRPSVKNNFADPDVKYYIDLLSLERFFTDFAVSRLIRKSGGIKNFEKNIQKLAKWSKNFENETIKQKLIPEGKDEKQYLKEILDGISQQSVLKWQNGEFCRDFTKKYKKKTPKIGGKKTRRRKKRTKNRTKKKRRKKRKS